MSAFVSRTTPVKTLAQKRLSRVATRTNTQVLAQRKPSPVIVFKPA